MSALVVAALSAVAARAAEERPCALVLDTISPHLTAVATHPPLLYVIGRAPWLGCLLARLPPAAALLTDAEPRDRWPQRLILPTPNALALILVEDAEHLQDWPAGLVHDLLANRALLWVASAPRDEPARLGAVRAFAAAVRLACVFEVHVAVTDPVDGTVFLYSGFTACGSPLHPEASERDRWTAGSGAGAGRWQRGELFLPVCTAWRPPPPGQPMSIFIVPVAARVAGSSVTAPGEDVVARALRETLHRAPHLARLGVRPVLGNATGARWAGQECRLDLMASMQSLQSRMHGRLVSYAWGMTNMVAVVPAGLGYQPGLLYQLTSEFTAAMWCATGLSALLVAASLVAVARARAGVLLPLLQSVAILLGQSPPGRSDLLWTPHERSVLGSWQLVCLVVATAYTGRLLTNLAVVTPHHEINTMEELARSDLKVLVPLGTAQDDLPSEVTGRVRPTASNVSAILELIAERRDSATFIDSSQLGLLVPLLRHPRKVFAFKAPLERLTSFFLSSPGSPFQIPLHNTLSRLRAAGIMVFWLRVSVEEFVRSFKFLEAERLESEDPQDSQEILDNYYLHYRRTVQFRPTKPLGATHAAPAFLLLGVGLAAAALAFSLEVTPWRWRGAARPRLPTQSTSAVREASH